MSFLKSRLLPLPLSFLCTIWGSGGILIGYYMYTLDSHNSSSFTTGRRRPSPRYFYDIFSTLYRFFPPRPRVFFKLSPFFSLRPNGLTFCFIYEYITIIAIIIIYLLSTLFVYSAPSSTALKISLIFFLVELNFISILFIREICHMRV
jgi:hypothetical protein